MKLREQSSPRAHVVIDDFLAAAEEARLRGEVKRLAPLRRIGYMGGRVLYRDQKRNRTVELSSGHRCSDGRTPLIAPLCERLWGAELQEKLREAQHPIYRILEHCHAPRLHVSWYGDGDYYAAHKDNNPPSNITILYLLGSERPAFRGGSFVLTHGGKSKRYAFKSNRLIIFPSDTTHEVTPVRMNRGGAGDERVSIQIWPAFGRGPLDKSEDGAISDAAPYVHDFRIPPIVWDGLAEFTRVVQDEAPWRGAPSLLAIFRTPQAVLDILVANLQYLSRRLFAHLRTSLDVVFSPRVGEGELARVTCRLRGVGASAAVGYVVRGGRSGFELGLFSAITVAGRHHETRGPISLSANAEQTVSEMRRVHQRALRLAPGLAGRTRARLQCGDVP